MIALYQVVMICWEGQKTKLEQLSKSTLHLPHARIWNWMALSLLEVIDAYDFGIFFYERQDNLH